LNENSNGLLRQHFPKGVELIAVADQQVQWAVDRLNHRPRKILGFKTPFEVFFGKMVRYTKPWLLHFEIESAVFYSFVKTTSKELFWQ